MLLKGNLEMDTKQVRLEQTENDLRQICDVLLFPLFGATSSVVSTHYVDRLQSLVHTLHSSHEHKCS